MPARLARLTSSSSVKPRSQAPPRSATVVPVQPQTTPSVGGGGQRQVGGRVADDAHRHGRRPSAPGRRAEPGPGRRPPCRPASWSRRPSRSAVTTARTRPARRPRTRTRRRRVRTDRRTPAQVHAGGCSSLGGARGDEPREADCPGTTGWISAAPVATTISRGMDVEHPLRRADDDRRAGVDRRRPPRRRRRRGRGPAARPARASAAAASPLDPPPMTATSTSRWCSSTSPGAASPSGPWRPPRGVPASHRPDAGATRSPARAAVWHVRT